MDAPHVTDLPGRAARDSQHGLVIPRLVAMLKDPAEEWTFDEYTAMNKKRLIEIWIANVPVLNTNTYPCAMPMNLLDKWRIWRATKVARNNYWLRKINAG